MITIEQQPTTGFVSAFNPIDFVVSTNNVSAIFNYLIRVKDAAANPISQHRMPKRAVNGRCMFDAQRTIQSYVSYDFTKLAAGTLGVYKLENLYKQFTIDFIEESGSTFSNITLGTPVPSALITAINTSFMFEEFKQVYLGTNNIDSYLVDSITTKFFSTLLRGANIRIRAGQAHELGWIGEPNAVTKVLIKTYNINKTLINSYTINNSFSNVSTIDKAFVGVNVGMNALNNQTLATGTQPILTPSVAYYEVCLLNDVSSIVSEIITFEIDTACLKYEPIEVYWLNKLGRFDSFSFNFLNEKSYQTTKSYFQKSNGAFVGNVFVRNNLESGDTAFNTKIESKVKITTDYINDIESQWLSELVMSPLCFAKIENTMQPVRIMQNDYTAKTNQKDSMFTQEFDLMFTNTSTRQRL